MREHGRNHKKHKQLEMKKKMGEGAECLMNFAQQLSKDKEKQETAVDVAFCERWEESDLARKGNMK